VKETTSLLKHAAARTTFNALKASIATSQDVKQTRKVYVRVYGIQPRELPAFCAFQANLRSVDATERRISTNVSAF